MMEKCTKCIHYDEMIDKLPRDAYIIQGKETEDEESHTCTMYKSIPKDIMLDKARCKYYMKRLH